MSKSINIKNIDIIKKIVYMYPILFESFVKLYFCFLAVFESLTGMLFYVITSLINPTSASCTETPYIYYCKSTFNDHLIDKCPSLHSFTPAPWAFGPIAQTVFSVFQIGCSKYQKREILTTNEGLPLILDIKLPTSSEKHHHAPIIVILHGTGGSSQSGLALLLADEAVKQGWHAIVVNKRGSGKGLQIFSSHTQTPDIQLVSDYVTNTYPHSKKILLGYSQGGNSVVHYLGHMSKQKLTTPYSGAICISCAFDIEIGTQMLAKSRTFANTLLTSQCKNILIHELPSLRKQCEMQGVKIDFHKAISCHDIRTFDYIMMIAPYLEKNKEGTPGIFLNVTLNF